MKEAELSPHSSFSVLGSPFFIFIMFLWSRPPKHQGARSSLRLRRSAGYDNGWPISAKKVPAPFFAPLSLGLPGHVLDFVFADGRNGLDVLGGEVAGLEVDHLQLMVVVRPKVVA